MVITEINPTKPVNTVTIQMLPKIIDKSAALKAVADEKIPKIENDDQMRIANELAKEIKSEIKGIEDACAEAIDGAHAVHKSMTTKRAELLAPYKALDTVIRQRIEVRLMEVRRLRQQEEAALEAQRKAREDEERARIDNEAKEVADALTATGREDEATEVLQQAEVAKELVFVPAQVPATPDAKAALGGNSSVTKYEFEVIDLLALVRAAAANPEALLRYLTADEVAIRAQVNASQLATCIPGVKVTEYLSLRVKSK